MFIEISNIRKGYGKGEARAEVLKGVSFSLEKGELCVLLLEMKKIRKVPMTAALKMVE